MAKPVASNLDFQSGSRVLNLPAPASPAEPVRLQDLNSAIEGLKNKDSVTVAAQGNINLASPGAAIDGETLVSGDRALGSVLLRFQTDPAENGLWIWNGATSPMTRTLDASTATELNNAVVSVQRGTDAGQTFRQSATVSTLNTDAVTWIDFGTGVSAATETNAGKIEIANQPETDAGTDDERAVTPLKLANWSGRKQKHAAVIGDGSATQFDITHNFGTRDVAVEVYRNASPHESIFCDISRPDTNTVRINFAVAPTTNQYRVTVIG